MGKYLPGKEEYKRSLSKRSNWVIWAVIAVVAFLLGLHGLHFHM